MGWEGSARSRFTGWTWWPGAIEVFNDAVLLIEQPNPGRGRQPTRAVSPPAHGEVGRDVGDHTDGFVDFGSRHRGLDLPRPHLRPIAVGRGLAPRERPWSASSFSSAPPDLVEFPVAVLGLRVTASSEADLHGFNVSEKKT